VTETKTKRGALKVDNKDASCFQIEGVKKAQHATAFCGSLEKDPKKTQLLVVAQTMI
jgi:hypothetical protein